jgi:hypothetical protein
VTFFAGQTCQECPTCENRFFVRIFFCPHCHFSWLRFSHSCTVGWITVKMSKTWPKGDLHCINSLNATLRSAFSYKNLVKKIGQKNFTQKNSKKKSFDNFSWNFFSIFFWLSWFHVKFGVCLRKFGGSRPAGLGGDRECTDST